MNRNEEYRQLMQELTDPPTALADVVPAAKKRLKRRRALTRPLMSMLGVFAAFVLLINLSPPVAEACSRIPFLKELAEIVNFSTSLTTAVENQYVQPMNLKQEENDITATVEYLIVDQKQVNVFFRLSSDVYKGLHSEPRVRAADGSALPCSYGYNSHRSIGFNGDLQNLYIDFVQGNVPSSLQLSFTVYEELTNDPKPLAVFTFSLDFDPTFTAVGKKHTVNQSFVLDGQTITVTDIEIYPSHLRLIVKEDASNTAWLHTLSFYIEDEHGTQFGRPANGVISTKLQNAPDMTVYYAESPYFLDSKSFKLVITGAKWLDKDQERIHLNLETGAIDPLPLNVVFLEARRQDNSWYLSFEKFNGPDGLPTGFYFQNKGLFSSIYYHNTKNNSEIVTLELQDYSDDVVVLYPAFNRRWSPNEPVVIPLT